VRGRATDMSSSGEMKISLKLMTCDNVRGVLYASGIGYPHSRASSASAASVLGMYAWRAPGC
jgi:hypothetical protein